MAKSKSTIKQEKSSKKDKRQVKEIESEDEFDQKLESTVNDTEFKLDAMTIEGEEETIEEDEEEKFSGDELNFPESDSDGSETLNEGDDDEEDGDDETVENGDDDEELESDPDVSEEDNEDSDSEFDWEEETKPKNEKKAKKDPNAPLPEIDPVYDSDSSTEETENTIGNVPMEWYDEFPHIGYTVDGKKIYRPAQGDELDKFLDQMDDPDAWKTVRDEAAQQNVKLSKEELEIIKKVQLGQFPQADYNPYEPTIEYFSSKVEEMPLSAAPEPKRRFQPSKWENQKIMKLVRAIRAGKIVLKKVKKNKTPKTYNLWDESAENKMRDKDFMPPPKKSLPDHSESYNPPEEYLFNDEEKEEWKNTAPEDREKDFIPEKFKNLRSVPGYARSFQEAFKRCMNLYLNPRSRKNKLDIDPESLIPKLPDPKDLQPFPTRLAIRYKGHTHRIRTFSLDPSGVYMVSGSDDKTVKIWEVSTGRCLKSYKFSAPIASVAWNPNSEISLIAICCENEVSLLCPELLTSAEGLAKTTSLISSGRAAAGMKTDKSKAEWRKPTQSEIDQDIVSVIGVTKDLAQVIWHRKGDYFASLSPEDGPNSILIHQLSKHSTQRPFHKLQGKVQKLMFHPTRPHFMVLLQRTVRIYNLQLQKLERTLQSGAQWLSSLDVHPKGDNVIVGSYDRRLCWFDLDWSSKPYKTLRFHKQAIRSVAYHPRYPLFASSSDDGTIQIFHGMVYSDLLQNPLIVPVKILRGHAITDSLGVLQTQFHPTQPWIFSCGADHTLCLYT